VNAETRRSEMYSENVGELRRLCNLLSLYVIGKMKGKHLTGDLGANEG